MFSFDLIISHWTSHIHHRYFRTSAQKSGVVLSWGAACEESLFLCGCQSMHWCSFTRSPPQNLNTTENSTTFKGEPSSSTGRAVFDSPVSFPWWRLRTEAEVKSYDERELKHTPWKCLCWTNLPRMRRAPLEAHPQTHCGASQPARAPHLGCQQKPLLVRPPTTQPLWTEETLSHNFIDEKRQTERCCSI